MTSSHHWFIHIKKWMMAINNALNKCPVLQENVQKQTAVHQEAQHILPVNYRFVLSTVSIHHNVLAQCPMALLAVQWVSVTTLITLVTTRCYLE